MDRKHQLCRPKRRWTALLAVGVAMEVYGLMIGDGAFSHWCRDVGHTDLPIGRKVFVVSAIGFGAWFVPHILDPEDNWIEVPDLR